MWKKILFSRNISSRVLLATNNNNCVKKVHMNAALLKQAVDDQTSCQEKWILKSRYSDIVMPPSGLSLTQFLFDKQEEFGDLMAFVNFETGEEFSHVDIRGKSLALSSALFRLGYTKGDVIGIMSPNCPELVISFLGLMNGGLIPSPMNSSYKEDEILYQLTNADCVAVICHEEKLPLVRNACRNCPNIRHIISYGSDEDGVLSFRKLLKDDGKGIPHIQFNMWEDLAVIPYSSGTTGLPKGVLLTHANLIANLLQGTQPDFTLIKDAKDGEQEIMLGLLPLYHIYGFALIITNSIYLGCKTVTMKEFKQQPFLDCIGKYKPTVLPLVPPLVGFLENSELVSPNTLDSVHTIFCGAAPLGQSMVDQFYEKFGNKTDINEGYGMTESSPVISMTPKGKLKIGSCGVLLSNTEAKLVDPDTEEIINPFEKRGELRVRGPQVMKGYLKNEEATRNTIKDGWLCTGDICEVDEDEALYIVDRIKELIKVKGLQVAPAELENVLRKHPGIDDVAVIGIPDERAGELPKAFVVRTKESENLTEEEIKEFVAQIVAPHKRLASVSFIEEIPKSAAGKILRKDLRKLV